jgi:hypothetical protein
VQGDGERNDRHRQTAVVRKWIDEQAEGLAYAHHDAEHQPGRDDDDECVAAQRVR